MSGVLVAVGLHALAIGLLVQLEQVRSALTQAAPIMVRLVAPPPPPSAEKAVESPKPLPPKPRVVRPKPLPKPPVITAVTEAPSSFVAPPPPPPAPMVDAPPEPIASAATAPPAPPTRPAPPAPAPITPPSFNADYLNNPAPGYPTLSRRMGEEGKVVLRVFVNEQGLPEQVQLRSSSGFNRLDSVALETVKQWKFVPARRGDQPVAAWVLVPISFSLRS